MRRKNVWFMPNGNKIHIKCKLFQAVLLDKVFKYFPIKFINHLPTDSSVFPVSIFSSKNRAK